EDVELARILSKRAGGIVVVVFIRVHEFRKRRQQCVTIVGEVLQYTHYTFLKRHDRNQVGCLHLRSNELVRRRKSTQLVRWKRVHHVEEKDQEPFVLVSHSTLRSG